MTPTLQGVRRRLFRPANLAEYSTSFRIDLPRSFSQLFQSVLVVTLAFTIKLPFETMDLKQKDLLTGLSLQVVLSVMEA